MGPGIDLGASVVGSFCVAGPAGDGGIAAAERMRIERAVVTAAG